MEIRSRILLIGKDAFIFQDHLDRPRVMRGREGGLVGIGIQNSINDGLVLVDYLAGQKSLAD